jgi:Fe-S-cluster containining protein
MAENHKTIDRIKQAFAVADAGWSSGAALAREGDLACRAGCFGCCVGLFEISFPEATLAASGFGKLPAAEKEDVVRRAERIVSTTARHFPGDPATGLLDPGRTEEADDRYFEVVADTACPMLELPSGRCRIYEYRPVTCRTYGLGWKSGDQMVHPSCGLNFVGAGEARQLETGVDLALLEDGERAVVESAAEIGLSPGDETTLAHAVTGSAFRTLRGEK